MNNLAQRVLTPPRGDGHKALEGQALTELYDLLGNSWELIENHHLEKTYSFNNFQEALDFTNKIGALAESVDHHPVLNLTWGKVTITIWTHSVEGLSEADFIFAAKADELSS